MDPAADPWGVRRAENLLTSLEGILSARVVTTPLGEVSEIHILAQGGQNPKQVVRNVESALLAHLGLKVDHRKISVAPTADVKPLQALDLGAVRDRAAQRLVLFEDLSLATVPKTRRVTATVTLAVDGRSETVTEEGPDTQRNRMETCGARGGARDWCVVWRAVAGTGGGAGGGDVRPQLCAGGGAGEQCARLEAVDGDGRSAGECRARGGVCGARCDQPVDGSAPAEVR